VDKKYLGRVQVTQLVLEVPLQVVHDEAQLAQVFVEF
jgi:hypothetical protein